MKPASITLSKNQRRPAGARSKNTSKPSMTSLVERKHERRQAIEIYTPKLQDGAAESGSSVFQLDYSGRPAFLAQSSQLARQMSIAAKFERARNWLSFPSGE